MDGINGKVEFLGGSYASKGLYGAGGSIAVPLGGQFGVQLDGGVGAFGNRFIGAGGGHLFWRDPRKGLIGFYGDHTTWDQYGGVHVSRFGGEAEAYFGRWTIYGLAGAEFGNNASTLVSSSSTVAIPGPGTLTTTTLSPALDDKTRFFDRITLSYYITDNWKASIGHRYLGGRHALTLGTEHALPVGRGVMGAVFAEARIGEGSGSGGWGGVRFYFGNSDKSLIRRQREDDPIGSSVVESLTDIARSLGTSSTTQSAACPPNEVFMNGQCVALVSDIRLKRDITLLGRLDNGIGRYRYRYLWSDTIYVGVMAQEVLDIVPEAVITGADGYYRVNYARLGLRLMTWQQWLDDAPTEMACAA